MGEFYTDIASVKRSTGRAITVGNFDGIHLGHCAMIEALCTEADRNGLDPLIITFNPHPREVINPVHAPKLIFLADEERLALKEAYRGDVLCMPFTEDIRKLTAREFISQVLINKLSMKTLVSGENNTMGVDRCGDQQRLTQLSQELNYDFVVVPRVFVDGHPLSSSEIRKAIAAGDMQAANNWLSQPYSISGEVIRGMGLGRKLGYPTANLRYETRKALPLEGVYAARVTVAGVKYGGMMFIGKNYLNPDEEYSVEANILQFDKDIYGEVITFQPIEFVRANRRMSDEKELVEQIGKDKIIIQEILERKETKHVCEE